MSASTMGRQGGRRGRGWPALMLAALVMPSWAVQPAGGVQALDDSALSEVTGRDGLAFNLKGFSMSGPLALTYTSPEDGNPSFSWSNLAISRSDDDSATFSDPYKLNIVARDGLSDVISLSNPLNASGLLKWQFAYDFSVLANGVAFDVGSVIFKDYVQYGGGMDITTPADPNVQGIAFGMSTRVDIGAIMLRPRGRGDTSLIDDSSVAEQLTFRGIHIGTPDGKPWQIADVTWQPGIFNAVTDADGKSYLHYGIDWSSKPEGAPVGSLTIDNITFKSDVTGTLNLGSSHIGGIQIQYLDIKFR